MSGIHLANEEEQKKLDEMLTSYVQTKFGIDSQQA